MVIVAFARFLLLCHQNKHFLSSHDIFFSEQSAFIDVITEEGIDAISRAAVFSL